MITQNLQTSYSALLFGSKGIPMHYLFSSIFLFIFALFCNVSVFKHFVVL